MLGLALLAAVTLMLQRREREQRLHAASGVEVTLNQEAQEVRELFEAGDVREAWLRADQLVRDAEALAAATVSREWAYADLRGRAHLLRAEAALELGGGAVRAEMDFMAALHFLRDTENSVFAPRARLGAARARLLQGDAKTAEAKLTDLLAKNPNYGAAYVWRAWARRALEDARGAGQDEEMARKFGFP